MYIGAHCICVNDQGLDCTDFEPCLPVKNGHYVVRDIVPEDNGDDDYCLGVMLVGIIGLTNAKGRETSFRADRFRLLEEIKAENIAKAEAENAAACFSEKWQ